MAGDLTDIAHVQDLVKRHIERYGGLDILVNNASKQILCSDFAEIDLNNVESTFRSNTLAMHALVKYALTHMKRGASIIQTSSMTAYKGSKGMVDYSSEDFSSMTLSGSAQDRLNKNRDLLVKSSINMALRSALDTVIRHTLLKFLQSAPGLR
ncbi:unnamed protein product [Tilletia controversa]|uniref:Uncharacterized protein n=2 Tax=Tilletia TaxID=13289 RepID=A0A8X7MM86_9BASI|nr:hypothetical protein CF335_g6689 [Tilletia laevis]KAE8240411.1 hypothetical protein A4X06_0g7781 [Tilletia controversa]KAE8248921.1 hypothetical protein A4X03_0g6688 [Tilletia caries]CAD6960363.1 unnamed protein product [Tilletia controversa]CAD6972239.1 unnamed protein product [Tilletia controversa]